MMVIIFDPHHKNMKVIKKYVGDFFTLRILETCQRLKKGLHCADFFLQVGNQCIGQQLETI
jgi:hypothetical protein